MLRSIGTVALGFAIAAMAAAEAPRVPLSETKKELQQLSERQKGPDGAELKDRLRASMPVPVPTVGADTPPPRPSLESMERERKQQEKARKNWLLNGVNQLNRDGKNDAGKEAGDTVASAEDAGDEDAVARIDSSDPAYLLKAYDQQQRLQERRTHEAKSAKPPVRPVDPLAPFLQGWLAGSPVREQALGNAPRQPVVGGTDPVVQGGGPAGGDVASMASRPVTASQVGNPYLSDSPAPAGLGIGRINSPDPATSQPVLPVLPIPTPSPVKPQAAPLAGPTSDSRRVAPPPPSDDKKYFPQLKKF